MAGTYLSCGCAFDSGGTSRRCEDPKKCADPGRIAVECAVRFSVHHAPGVEGGAGALSWHVHDEDMGGYIASFNNENDAGDWLSILVTRAAEGNLNHTRGESNG